MVSRFHLFHFFEEPEPDRGVPQGANANVSSFIAIRIKFQDILSFIDQKQGQDGITDPPLGLCRDIDSSTTHFSSIGVWAARR